MEYAPVKRALDIAISSALLLLLLPVLALVAAVIRLESHGSPLFVQSRVGQGGRVFRMVKFRSMVKDAPSSGSWRTGENDPRITRVGRFIRRTSLDELPQLWNVLTGEMSLIGPRPQTPEQIALYTPEDWQARHRVRPGITGLAQTSGRSAITLDEQVACDRRYAEHPTPWLDMRIILATIRQAACGKGAN